MITEIIAAGAMGISVFFVVKAHSLLKDEQAKETPRPSILRQITIFMGFAILMTPIALGIEYLRHRMDFESKDLTGFAEDLNKIKNDTIFSFDEYGSPKEIEVVFEGQSYQLGFTLPEDQFKNIPLELIKGDGNRYLAVKNNGNDKPTTFGFFKQEDLVKKFRQMIVGEAGPEIDVDEELESVKLLATGMIYAPYSPVRNKTYAELTKKEGNYKLSNKYLLDFVDTTSFDHALKKVAISLLIHDNHMAELNPVQYNRLIGLLSDNSLSVLPRRYYELAQVYYSRWEQQGHAVSDRKKYLQLLCSYKNMYKPEGKDTTSVGYKWYKKTKKDLKVFRFDDDCNCVSNNCP